MIIIDRFEGDLAVCEINTEKRITVHRSQLPADAAEGDIIVPAPDGTYSIDHEATMARKRSLRSRLLRFRSKKSWQ